MAAVLPAAGLLATVWLFSSARNQEPESLQSARLRLRVVSVRPHDPKAYTQGLLWHAGFLYESTGQYGESSLRKVDPTTGVVVRQVQLPERLFGEGLARVDGRLVQLTWQQGLALIWDLEDFRQVDQWSYEGEGWGLCFDGTRLVMSNGSSVLSFRDPGTFAVTGRLAVRVGKRPVLYLNELECAQGWIWANLWMTEQIARIDPQSGEAVLVDASGLLRPEERQRADVLNGIAYDPGTGSYLLTGKYWPKLFEVVFVEESGS